MGKIRPLVADDIPHIAELRRRTFPHSSYRSVSELGAHLTEMFLDGPWCDHTLTSLVYENEAGRVVGFLGLFPRSMLLDGRPIRAAVLTQLMVDPAHRGGVGRKLLQESFAGSQDLSLADSANEVGRQVWQSAGGRTALLYSLYWTRPLRPWRYAAAGIGGGTVQRLIRGLANPVLTIADAAATRLDKSWFRLKAPASPGADLTVRTMVEHWPTMTSNQSLTAQADETMFVYVLRELERKRELGLLERIMVRDGNGTVIGWYVYYVKARDIGEVVQLAAVPGKYGDVFDHMCYHAWRRGVLALQGRLEPQLLPDLEAKQCVFRHIGPWTVAQSANPDILSAIERGNALISRLDGEFWMVF